MFVDLTIFQKHWSNLLGPIVLYIQKLYIDSPWKNWTKINFIHPTISTKMKQPNTFEGSPPSDIVSDTYPNIVSDILSDEYSDIPSDILEGWLAFYLTSSARRWGPAVPNEIWSSRLRSGRRTSRCFCGGGQHAALISRDHLANGELDLTSTTLW